MRLKSDSCRAGLFDQGGKRRLKLGGGAEAGLAMIDKRVDSLAAAVAGISDGATVLCGGFGAVGEPFELVEALVETGARDLTVVCNNAGSGLIGVAALLKAGRARKLVCSYPRSTDPQVIDALYRDRRIELEIMPQGTLSERLRAAAAGIGGFFTRVGAETKLAAGKETRLIEGVLHVFEAPLPGDIALIKAHRADPWGNLVYRKAARNFNPVMAMAAKITAVQVSEIVELAALDPEAIATPGIFVDRVVVV